MRDPQRYNGPLCYCPWSITVKYANLNVYIFQNNTGAFGGSFVCPNMCSSSRWGWFIQACWWFSKATNIVAERNCITLELQMGLVVSLKAVCRLVIASTAVNLSLHPYEYSEREQTRGMRLRRSFPFSIMYSNVPWHNEIQLDNASCARLSIMKYIVLHNLHVVKCISAPRIH